MSVGTVAQLTFCCPSLYPAFTKHSCHSCKPLWLTEFSDQSCCYPPKNEIKNFLQSMGMINEVVFHFILLFMKLCLYGSFVVLE